MRWWYHVVSYRLIGFEHLFFMAITYLFLSTVWSIGVKISKVIKSKTCFSKTTVSVLLGAHTLQFMTLFYTQIYYWCQKKSFRFSSYIHHFLDCSTTIVQVQIWIIFVHRSFFIETWDRPVKEGYLRNHFVLIDWLLKYSVSWLRALYL